MGASWSIGGVFHEEIEEMESNVSPDTLNIIARAMEDLPPGKVIDHHVHLLGISKHLPTVGIEGVESTGAYVHPR